MTDTQALARQIRIEALQMVHRAKASHIGSALSISDIVAVLYGQVMRLDPKQPDAPNRDRFILSKGHACVAVYAALAETGFFPREDLLKYGQDHSVLMNHISHKVAGVEFSTGSLGHGLPFGTGKALAANRRKDDWSTFVLLSDGELGEGSNWEAMMFASHHSLDNLTAILDNNKVSMLDFSRNILDLDPLIRKVESFGFNLEIVDGHKVEDVYEALKKFKNLKNGKPNFLICNTLKGKGAPQLETNPLSHILSLKPQEIDAILTGFNYVK